jgi:hypothetical protein
VCEFRACGAGPVSVPPFVRARRAIFAQKPPLQLAYYTGVRQFSRDFPGKKGMNFQQAYEAAKNFTSKNSDIFENVDISFPFDAARPPIGDWRNEKNMGMLVTGDGVGIQSGIYMYASPDGEVIYIGKATKNNLHQRAWGHINTPTELNEGMRTFPRHSFKNPNAPAIITASIESGTIKLGVICLSKSEPVSLLEVYLQTLYLATHKSLPLFNKKIG